jgi:hypothetical protein
MSVRPCSKSNAGEKTEEEGVDATAASADFTAVVEKTKSSLGAKGFGRGADVSGLAAGIKAEQQRVREQLESLEQQKQEEEGEVGTSTVDRYVIYRIVTDCYVIHRVLTDWYVIHQVITACYDIYQVMTDCYVIHRVITACYVIHRVITDCYVIHRVIDPGVVSLVTPRDAMRMIC